MSQPPRIELIGVPDVPLVKAGDDLAALIAAAIERVGLQPSAGDVIAIAQKSIRRHARYLRQMGLMDRLAGERPLDVSVAESASEGTFTRMVETGRALVNEDGADVVIMGCAGMARHRRPLEDALGVPVIDPTQAAVAIAIGTVQTAL